MAKKKIARGRAPGTTKKRKATSARGADARPMFAKVAFTMYPVKDAQRARAFYGGTLGLTVGSKSSNGVWTEYDLPGGGCLALFANEAIAPSAEAGGSVALEVADLDALCARLKGEGVRFKADMIHSPVCRMSVILDSEGNSIILHELKVKKRSPKVGLFVSTDRKLGDESELRRDVDR